MDLWEVSIEFFTNSPQYKNDNIANFVFGLPSEIDYTNRVVLNREVLNSEAEPFSAYIFKFLVSAGRTNCVKLFYFSLYFLFQAFLIRNLNILHF